MVEMRWAVRKEDAGFSRMAGIRDVVGMVRILQYRVLRDVVPATTEMHAAPFPFLIKKEWSEWMDVPVVPPEG